MNRTRSTAITVVVLVTAGLATSVLFTGAVAAQDAGQIDECTTVSEAGEYELGSIGGASESNGTNETGPANESAAETESNDSVANETNETAIVTTNESVVEASAASSCIVVEADDVVLDGNGSVLDGHDAAGSNLTSDDAANESTNATASNASVGENESAANDNESVINGSESVVNGITIRPPADADTVTNVTVRDVTVRNWYVGVYVQNASNVTLDNVTFEDNAVPGFRVDNSTGLSVQSGNESVASVE